MRISIALACVAASLAAAGAAQADEGMWTFDNFPSAAVKARYGVAIDQSTDVLYIADTSNSKIAAVTGLAQSGNAAGPAAPAHS